MTIVTVLPGRCRLPGDVLQTVCRFHIRLSFELQDQCQWTRPSAESGICDNQREMRSRCCSEQYCFWHPSEPSVPHWIAWPSASSSRESQTAAREEYGIGSDTYIFLSWWALVRTRKWLWGFWLRWESGLRLSIIWRWLCPCPNMWLCSVFDVLCWIALLWICAILAI